MNASKNTARIEKSVMKNKVQIGVIILGLITLNANIFAQTKVQPYISEQYTNTLVTSGTEIEKVQKEMKSELSTLWTVVTLNMITADVLSLYVPEVHEEFTEFADGREGDLMLLGAILYQMPISMIYLSKVLPYKANRIANMVVAGLQSAAVIGAGITEPHYIVLGGAEVVWMSLIAWKAWKWQNPEGKHNDKKHDLGLNLNYDKKAYGLSYTYNF